MSMDDNWSNLEPGILILILKKFNFLGDYLRFIAVCKSWRNSVSGLDMPGLPPDRFPFLLLAEDVAPGVLTSDCEFDSDHEDNSKIYYDEEVNYDDDDSEEEEEEEEEDSDGVKGVAEGGEEEDIGDEDEENSDDSEEEEDSDDDEDSKDSEEEDSEDSEEEEDSEDSEEEEDSVGVVGGAEEDIGEDDKYNYLNNTIGSSRGLYSLRTGKTYIIDLPEAAGRLLLGITKGWLVTLGRDLQVNLLHPLLRYQISLPPMLSFPRQYDYNEDYPPEEPSDFFICKVAVSSKILNKNTIFSLYHHHAGPSPIVMAIYGERQYLGFARLGDKVWTDVKLYVSRNIVYDKGNFEDIAYHKGNFYVVDAHGGIFVCGNDDNEKGGDFRGRQIASLETKDWLQKYLVESSSGSGLLLLVRYRKQKFFDEALRRWPKYRTTNFLVWRLDLKYSDSLEDISCTLKEEKYLGNEAIFIGTTSSIAVSSSESIKPNSIYFTDDNWLLYYRTGGGHDMGIFNMEHRTIEPHFQGKSIHPISPPLWYF